MSESGKVTEISVHKGDASLAGVVRLLTQDLGSGYRSRGVTTKYFALLGMPLVKTVTSAGPCRKPSSEKESKLVSDQPRSGSIGRKVTSLLSILRNCTIG